MALSPSSLKAPSHPDWPKPLLVIPNNSSSSTGLLRQVLGMGMGLWQSEAQELEAALGAFPSWASSVFGESRGEFLLVLPFLLCASSPGCALYFLTPGWSFPWELPSSCAACSRCWAAWDVLVQLCQGHLVNQIREQQTQVIFNPHAFPNPGLCKALGQSWWHKGNCQFLSRGKTGRSFQPGMTLWFPAMFSGFQNYFFPCLYFLLGICTDVFASSCSRWISLDRLFCQ